MCRIIALIVGLTIDTWKSTKYSFFGHGFDIAVYSRSPNLGFTNLDLIIDIIRREMSASAGSTDDITILVSSHTVGNKLENKRKYLDYGENEKKINFPIKLSLF
jgi:hypothetical protein